jgi:VWFA-related protein
LKFFAEKSGGTFVATPGGAALREAFRKIAEDLGVQYTIVYSPTNSAKNGKWRAIEVKIGRPNLDIRTRRGYYAEKAK